MGNCLNILKESVIFLPSTALIVLILLVWAQLQAGSPRVISDKVDEDKGRLFTLFLGSFWIYVAIFFALTAFVLHVFERYEFAIGCFMLSFLIAVSQVFLAIFRHFLLLVTKYKGVEIKPDSREAKELLCATSIFVVGLGVLSFSLAYGYLLIYWWIWILIGIFVVIPILYILGIMVKSILRNK